MRYSLLAVVFAVAVAGTARAEYYADVKQYGNCFVRTETDINEFTDSVVVVHTLICMEEPTLTGKNNVVLMWSAGQLMVGLSLGRQSNRSSRVNVGVRVDGNKPLFRLAHWERDGAKYAYVRDDLHLVRALLTQLPNGNRLAIKIGDRRGTIQLTGSRDAVADFRDRTGLQEDAPGQSLTIEPQIPEMDR